MPEFDSLSALAASEVPAPRVYLASDDPTILGAPFFLSEKVEGDTPLPWGSQGHALEGARRESLAADFIGALAALHRFDWRATSLAKWGEGVTLENAAHRQIDDWEARFHRWALRPHPMAHRALAWLRARAPVARASFARARRLPARQLSRTAMGGLPPSSTGSLCILATRSRISAGPSCPNTAAARRWSAASPAKRTFSPATKLKPEFRSIAPRSVSTIVFSLLKLAFTHMAAARCFEQGLFNDMRMPAMATQIAPVFRQISRTLEQAA